MSAANFAPVLFVVLLLGAACAPPTQYARESPLAASTNENRLFSNPLEFSSTLEVTEFVVENEKLVAIGLFTVTDFEGNTQTAPVTLPVNDMSADATCSVLTVTMGPLDLQVLGMAVNAQTVQLVTVANPDKGFSGVLLCGIVDAFKNADMNLVATMLNEVLALFGWS